MDFDLKGKTAIITGSSHGLGKSIAFTLHNQGCNVMLNGRNKKSLESTLAEFGKNCEIFVGDVTNPLECKELTKNTKKKFGTIDILICNVGSGRSVKPGHETISEWKRILDLNFFSSINMIESCSNELSKNNGTIVCISSIAGLENIDAPITYSVAKSALNTYVKAISKPLADKNIRINAVAPGNLLFPGSVWDKKIKQNKKEIFNMINEKVPLKKFGKLNEISPMVAFLASPLSSFITGSIFVVDGGQTKRF